MGTFPYTNRQSGHGRKSRNRGELIEARFTGAFVANNKNPNQKQPGEKEPGTFHYNPGNMSGKPIGASKDESERRSSADGTPSRHEQQDKRTVDK